MTEESYRACDFCKESHSRSLTKPDIQGF